jgi:hypothetical protein
MECLLAQNSANLLTAVSGVHSIMMETSALACEDGGCTPTPFQPITIMYKGAVYAPGERADTLLLFHLYPYMYSVVCLLHEILYRFCHKVPCSLFWT